MPGVIRRACVADAAAMRPGRGSAAVPIPPTGFVVLRARHGKLRVQWQLVRRAETSARVRTKLTA
jgi:hypothetical protein